MTECICGSTTTDGKCDSSGMTAAICGHLPFEMESESGQQPVMCRVLLSDDGNAYDATECATCREVIGPFPQEPHHLADCVRSLAKRIDR